MNSNAWYQQLLLFHFITALSLDETWNLVNIHMFLSRSFFIIYQHPWITVIFNKMLVHFSFLTISPHFPMQTTCYSDTFWAVYLYSMLTPILYRTLNIKYRFFYVIDNVSLTEVDCNVNSKWWAKFSVLCLMSKVRNSARNDYLKKNIEITKEAPIIFACLFDYTIHSIYWSNDYNHIMF